MVVEFLGKRQGFANESANSLPQGAGEALNVLSTFAVAMMAIAEDDRLVSPKQVSVALGVQVASGQAVPSPLCA